jgi:DNA-binding response OmpR family regulator
MPRLLLVDDDRDGLEIRRLIFERKGYRVSIATGAGTARAAFSKSAPEFVVLDLRLPLAEDGLALIREFRAQVPQVRIIVLSGWTADLNGRPEAAMADAVLAKPVRSEKLIRTLAQARRA